jgi:uncharacterized protein YfaP (DUF2135 family)
MTATVLPIADLHIELVWFSDNSDVDLHYRTPTGFWFDCPIFSNDGSDCYYCTDAPDWGPFGADLLTTNDPVLDVDNVIGFGPENINQANLYDDGPFRIGVHYYSNSLGASGKVRARIRVFISGVMVLDVEKRLACNEFWEAADVDVSGSGTTVVVTPLGGNPSSVTNGSCF